jgi:hypothetical protein
MSETQTDSERGVHAQIQHSRLKLLSEKLREYKLKTNLLFTDYEKASDSVQKTDFI